MSFLTEPTDLRPSKLSSTTWSKGRWMRINYTFKILH